MTRILESKIKKCVKTFQIDSNQHYKKQIQKMSEGGHFTMDFVEEEHRQNIQMVMQILCIDLQHAYDLYMNAGCNVQAAINNHTNPQQQMQSQSSNNRGGNRRNAISHQQDYHHELNELHNAFDNDDDDQEFASLPMARGRPYHPQRVEQQCEFDVKFNKFLQIKRKKKTFDKTYKIRREVTNDSISSKIFNKPVKKKTPLTEPYIKKIQRNFLDRKCPIKFGIGSMSESLQNSWKTQLPLVLYHLNFDTTKEQQTKSLPKVSNNVTKPKKQVKKKKKMCIDITGQNSEEKLVEQDDISHVNLSETKIAYEKSSKNQFLKYLLLNERFCKMVNEVYLNYVFDADNYDLEIYFKEYFKRESKGKSFLIVLRVNVMEQIEFVGKVSLDDVLTQHGEKEEKQEKMGPNQLNENEERVRKIVEELRVLRHKVIQTQKQESYLHERYTQFQKGNYHYDYVKPLTNTQKKKIKEDRELIQQQQQQFLEIQNQMMQQKKAQQNSETQLKEKVSKEQILEKRKNIRQKLKKYEAGPGVMMIKLRLPNGKSIVLNVSLQEKIQYLFDFVYSFQEENIGFEAQEQDEVVERVFDIIRPEDRQELSTKTESTLGAFFQDSLMESLIVKQK